MNSKENFLSCLRMQPHTGVPSFLFDTSFGTGIAGYPVSEIYGTGFDGEKSAKSICAGRRFLGHDAVPGSMICMDTRVFGATTVQFKDRPPMIEKAAFSDPSELYRHEVSEIHCRTADEIIRSNNLLKEMDPDAAVAAYIPSPFLFSAILRGLESLMMDLLSDMDYVKDLMAFTKGCCDILAKRHADETGSDCSVIPGAYDNVDLIGAEAVREVCIPSLRDIIRTLHGADMPIIFHPHGEFTKEPGTTTLGEFIDTGFDCIYYGENCDHRRMCQLTNGKTSVMGGIDTATTIFLGPDSKVRKDTEDVLEQTSGYDFIYSCSCSIDQNLNAERLRIMMDTVRAHR